MKKFLFLQACEFTKHDELEEHEDSGNGLYDINQNENFFRCRVNQTNRLLSERYEILIENLTEEFERRYHQMDENYNDIINQRDTSIREIQASNENLRSRELELEQNLRESQDEINQKNESIRVLEIIIEENLTFIRQLHASVDDHQAAETQLQTENEGLIQRVNDCTQEIQVFRQQRLADDRQ